MRRSPHKKRYRRQLALFLRSDEKMILLMQSPKSLEPKSDSFHAHNEEKNRVAPRTPRRTPLVGTPSTDEITSTPNSYGGAHYYYPAHPQNHFSYSGASPNPYAYGHMRQAQVEEWVCPTCRRVNTSRYDHCRFCRPETTPARWVEQDVEEAFDDTPYSVDHEDTFDEIPYPLTAASQEDESGKDDGEDHPLGMPLSFLSDLVLNTEPEEDAEEITGGRDVKVAAEPLPFRRRASADASLKTTENSGSDDSQSSIMSMPEEKETRESLAVLQKRVEGDGETQSDKFSLAIQHLEKNNLSTHYDDGMPVPDFHRLLFPEDKEMLTDYFYYIMQQLRHCQFTERDRKTRGGKRLAIHTGYSGLQCVHCAKVPKKNHYPRKFFWASVDRLANSFAEIPSHILKCKGCPRETQEALLTLKTKHSQQMAQLPRGSQKDYFRRMWKRLHTLDSKQSEYIMRQHHQEFIPSPMAMSPSRRPPPSPREYDDSFDQAYQSHYEV